MRIPLALSLLLCAQAAHAQATLSTFRPTYLLPFTGVVHESVTDEAAAPFLASGRLSLADVSAIKAGNLSQDQGAFFDDPKRHVDDCTFAAAALYLPTEWATVLVTAPFDRAATLTAFGRIAHTVQDFHSHSNWIEKRLNDSPIQPWDFNIASLTPGTLSGYWPDNAPQNSLIPGAPSHDALNKDSPTSKEGKKIVPSGPNAGKTYHTLARQVAARATAQQIERLVQVLPPPNTRLDDAIVWNPGAAYFFQGGRYIRYNIAGDSAEGGYPRAIAPNWKGLFGDRIDSSLLWNDGKAYFFRGDSYIRYDVASDRADSGYPRKISASWPGVFPSGIDASVLWNNGKAYFFKGDSYVRYDVASDKADPGFPLKIAAGWKGIWPSGIDAVVLWPGGKAYFFKGNQYIRYDVAQDRADPGYPKFTGSIWRGVQF